VHMYLPYSVESRVESTHGLRLLSILNLFKLNGDFMYHQVYNMHRSSGIKIERNIAVGTDVQI
jgi:hypothetical protein